jgi:hypothetical protein
MTEPPLVAIAAGKKVRVRKAPTPVQSELLLHISVANLLKRTANPRWRWTHIGHGERREARTAAKLKAMGVQAGWPDFIFIAPDGMSYFLELKRKGGRPSLTQQNFSDWCYSCHIAHCTAYNIDEAITFLRDHNIILIRR